MAITTFILEIGTMPTAPARISVASVNLAAGASDNLDSSVIPAGVTGKLNMVTLSSSLAGKWVLNSRDGPAETEIDTIFTGLAFGGQNSYAWVAPHEDFAQQAGDGVDTTFRVTVTNLDDVQAADFYATFYWDEE